MPRSKMAIAIAPAWASLKLPSASPCAKRLMPVGRQRPAVALAGDQRGRIRQGWK
jgi:hypothetical protein